MKVLIAHIPYRQRGGEDHHVELLTQAYRTIGVEPILYPSLREAPQSGVLQEGFKAIASDSPPADFLKLWERERPAFIHAHNLFPTLGPAFLRWVIRESVRLVMTVHNHRFYCANGLALRDRKICKDCFGTTVQWRPVVYNCNGSFVKSAFHASALTAIRRDDLYLRAVSVFLAPSPYIAEELHRSGVPRDRIRHILNPVESLAEGDAAPTPPTGEILYAGRLSPEKGIQSLLKAVSNTELKLTIAGDGELRDLVKQATHANPRIQYRGLLPSSTIRTLLRHHRVGVLPSICNEILPTFVLECYAAGLPCIIPDAESTRWLAGPEWGDLGVLFRSGDARDLARALQEGLQRPRTSVDLRQIRERLSLQRFCLELRSQIVNN